MRLALIPITACLLSCARPDYAEAYPDHVIFSAGPQPGYAIKRVVEKQSPATLVGDDGSFCVTSTERFAATEVGSWIACDWTLPSPDSTTTTSASVRTPEG